MHLNAVIEDNETNLLFQMKGRSCIITSQYISQSLQEKFPFVSNRFFFHPVCSTIIFFTCYSMVWISPRQKKTITSRFGFWHCPFVHQTKHCDVVFICLGVSQPNQAFRDQVCILSVLWEKCKAFPRGEQACSVAVAMREMYPHTRPELYASLEYKAWILLY